MLTVPLFNVSRLEASNFVLAFVAFCCPHSIRCLLETVMPTSFLQMWWRNLTVLTMPVICNVPWSILRLFFGMLYFWFLFLEMSPLLLVTLLQSCSVSIHELPCRIMCPHTASSNMNVDKYNVFNGGESYKRRKWVLRVFVFSLTYCLPMLKQQVLVTVNDVHFRQSKRYCLTETTETAATLAIVVTVMPLHW